MQLHLSSADPGPFKFHAGASICSWMHSPDGPSAESVAIWTGLVRTTDTIRDAIEAALKARGLPPLSWYDVLWELERAGPGGLRQNDLQARLLLVQYHLSRLLARMEAAGLV